MEEPDHRVAGCGAHAASGHVTAAPPKRLMKSCRLMALRASRPALRAVGALTRLNRSAALRQAQRDLLQHRQPLAGDARRSQVQGSRLIAAPNPPHPPYNNLEQNSCLINASYLSVSDLTKLINSGTDIGLTSAPARVSDSFTSDSARMPSISRLSLVTISLGVPRGAKIPAHRVTSKFLMPLSSTVGTLGTAGERCAEERARIFSLPACTSGMAVGNA